MTYTVSHPTIGDITVKRVAHARHIKMYVTPNGTPTITTPAHTPKIQVKLLLKTDGHTLEALLRQYEQANRYAGGMTIGISQTLVLHTHDRHEPIVTTTKQSLIITLPEYMDASSREAQAFIRTHVISNVRKQAKAYLPKRLAVLAERSGLTYEKCRLTHSRSRWGSCSSTGTISLNIALMTCSLDEIDYVIYHELAHTRHMDHSTAFWRLVDQLMPNSDVYKTSMKRKTPSM